MTTMMQRKVNFNAGPAALPETVLLEFADAVREYGRSGISILELPHRGKEFADIVKESEELVRELCDLDDQYEVVWAHGGGRMQFCLVPMNFLFDEDSAGYIDSGHWAEEALEYATHYGDVQVLASSKQDNYSRLPDWPVIPPQLNYVHFTTNNTIYGTQWHSIPRTDVPLIADMSSDIFSYRQDYSKYAMFYAAAQKNLGTPGVALVVVRKDMLQKTRRTLPPMFDYRALVKERSVLNTANVSGVYLSLLMLRWTKARGIDNMERDNRKKAQLLYDVIDSSKIFTAHVSEKSHRSLMNVCFTAINAETEKAFLDACESNNIIGIKGHRSVGGFRISLYNPITVEEVKKLTTVINEFARNR
jgi:phosphoserine aminotransferase